MASNETNDESDNNYAELELAIKGRSDIICLKEVSIPCVHNEDTDLTDVLKESNIPKTRPHNNLQNNEQSIQAFIENIRKLKSHSESEMNFDIEENKNIDIEINKAMSSVRQQSEKLFKRIINTQVGFHENLNNDSMTNSSEIKDYVKDHTELIKQTCQFDRGVESVILCDKDSLGENINKDLKIKNLKQYKQVCHGLKQETLNTVYEQGVKSSKNHEHLLAIKQLNKPKSSLGMEEMTSNQLDPFSKLPITKPVLNRVCKHIYDQQSIDKMFQKKLFVHCPVIGCKNKHVLRKDLE